MVGDGLLAAPRAERSGDGGAVGADAARRRADFGRGGGVDYGRVRVWGSIGFIAGSLGAGIMLGIESGETVLLLVMAASALVFLTCCKIPEPRLMARSPDRRAGLRLVLSDRRFWLFVAVAAALQASHQVYYGFGTLYWRSLGLSDTAIGWLWAEGVIAEIALFWHARRLSNRFGAVGLMALGGGAGIVRWSLAALLTSLPAIAALQPLHALTFGAVHLGAMQFITRAAPPHAAVGAQTAYAAVSAGFGSGLVMLAAGTLYARLGGYAYLPMALLSAAGLAGTLRLRAAAR